MVRKRVEKKDPDAILFMGNTYCNAELGLQKDVRKAIELWTEAAELGSLAALCNLGVAYYYGQDVEEDKAKGIRFYEKAAKQGHVESRHNLGCIELDKRNHDRAVRHYLVSAKMGYAFSVESIKKMFMRGAATKEQYAQALKGYQAAVEEMKSLDRDEARGMRSKGNS